MSHSKIQVVRSLSPFCCVAMVVLKLYVILVVDGNCPVLFVDSVMLELHQAQALEVFSR